MTLTVAASLVATMADVPGWQPAQAAPQPPDPSATGTLERPDEASALITARISGKRIRITGLTTETDQAWAEPNGTVTWEHHYRPVRVKRGDEWTPADTTLRVRADGSVAPTAAAVDVSFSGGGTAPLVKLTNGDDSLALGSPVGALPTPVLDGDTATYPEVLPGVDLQLRADVEGFSQLLVVKTPQAAANPKLDKLTFRTTGDDLAVTADKAGNLDVVDTDTGRTVFSGNTPLMWDADAEPATTQAGTPPTPAADPDPDQVTMPVQVGTSTLSVTPNQQMLSDPDTSYPVYIDPGVTANRSNWIMVDSATPNTTYWNPADDAMAGTWNSGVNKRRSFFNLNVADTPIAGKHILAAKLNLHQKWANTCTPTRFDLYSTSIATPTSTWNNQPTWHTLQDSATTAKGYSSACPAGYIQLNATNITQAAANGNWTTITLGVRAASETDNTYWKRFTNSPYLTISYTAFPTIGTRSTVPSSTCTTGTGRPYLNTTTPQFKTQVNDPEGASVRPEFEWAPVGGTVIGSAQPVGQASGTTFTTTVPAGQLTNGASYAWRVRGFDSTVWGTWSPWCEFTVDTTVPTAPTVSSTTYPSAAWAGSTGTPGTFTLNPGGVADVASYLYRLSSEPTARAVNAPTLGGSATVSVTPTVDGPNVLYVTSRDRAGNQSPPRAYTFNVGSGAVTAPRTGDITTGKTVLKGVGQPTATGVTYQWRRGDADTWTVIPAAHVRHVVGGATVTWPLASTGSGAFPDLTWDLEATLAAVDAQAIPRDGPLQVRASYNTGTITSAAVKFTFDRDQASAASSPMGPGEVNLLTGNYSISQADVSVAGDGGGLAVGRTFNTRQAGTSDVLFGPGWTSGMVGLDADLAYTKLTVHGSLVQAGQPDGTTIGFTKKATTATGASFEAQTDAHTLTLIYTTVGDSYTLTDHDGAAVTFTRQTGDPAGQYVPTSTVTAGAAKTVTYSWERVTINGATVVRPTRILAPVPDGVASCATLVRGCRALTISYATATTATGTTEATWGTYTGRATQISFTAWDPDLATPAMRTIVMARYSYDNTGRLRAAWDPRLDWTDTTITPPAVRSLRTTYTYDTDGILTAVTPPAQQPWQFTYTTLPTDPGKGRLHKVTRSALAAGTATDTIVYRVPTSGTGAPYDLSAGQTTRWGQTEPPVDATAIFPATQIPTGNPTTGTLPTSWERATITYLDANTRTVNTAQPGGYLNATIYDMSGNVVAQLSSANRVRALDASVSDNSAAEAQLAAALSEASVYTPDGARITDTFGPEHDVVLPDGNVVRGRAHTNYTYDQGAPIPDGPFDLVTTETTTVRYWNTAGAQTDADARTTTTTYDWNLRQPTTVTVDPNGLKLATTTVYDADGRVFDHTTPGAQGATGTPYTLRTIYYTTAANSTYPDCGGRPEWNGLPCRTQPRGDSPASAPLTLSLTTYDMYQQRRTVIEKTEDNEHLRTTTITYDGAGRPYEVAVVSPAGLGEPIPTRRQVYDPATGQAVRTQSISSANAVTAEIVRGYDTLGRLTSYTDADGSTATTGYDLLSRLDTVNDGKAVRTYTYDGGTERRGLPTALVDSQAGTFTAQYDADGIAVAQRWPNGITVGLNIDEVGAPTNLTYTKPDCGTANCILFTETVDTSVHGQRRAGTSTLSEQTFGYDRAGRLTTTTDAIAGVCTSRTHTYSAATNRTSTTSYGPDTNGACQTTTAESNRTWSYDNADRLTTTGTTYDMLGRTTTVATADTVGAGPVVTNQYYVNNMVRQITQGTTITTFALDPIANRIRTTQTGTKTRVNHYSDDGDSPAWTAEGDSYTRILSSLGGIAGLYTGVPGHIEWQITNLHGDFVATIIDGAIGLSVIHETDEQGQPRDTNQSQRRYSWLGAAQRAADNPGNLITMGVRLYNPATSRFLSSDPVYGGNANAYEYCAGDSLNCSDISGAIRQTCYGTRYKTSYSFFGGTTRYYSWYCYFSHKFVTTYLDTLEGISIVAGIGSVWYPPLAASAGIVALVKFIGSKRYGRCKSKAGFTVNGEARSYHSGKVWVLWPTSATCYGYRWVP